ncbi:MAG: hypothetical protein ACFFB5_12585 [Promethearchaeota archaeon]
MKLQFTTSGILSIFFLGTLLIQSNMIYATNQQCPFDVQILDSKTSWCSGKFSRDNITTTCWDVITLTHITLGVANLDTTIHSLNQLILTIEEIGERGVPSFLKSENLTLNMDLSLILSPQKYWSYNFSCSECQSLVKISLEADGEWFEFDPDQILIDAGIYLGTTYWPPHWSNVSYYTEKQTIAVSFLEILFSVGIFNIIILIFRRRREKD